MINAICRSPYRTALEYILLYRVRVFKMNLLESRALGQTNIASKGTDFTGDFLHALFALNNCGVDFIDTFNNIGPGVYICNLPMKEKEKEGMKNVSKLRPCKLKNGSSIQEEGLARPKHEVIYCHAYSFLVFFFKKKLSYKEAQ